MGHLQLLFIQHLFFSNFSFFATHTPIHMVKQKMSSSYDVQPLDTASRDDLMTPIRTTNTTPMGLEICKGQLPS